MTSLADRLPLLVLVVDAARIETAHTFDTVCLAIDGGADAVLLRSQTPTCISPSVLRSLRDAAAERALLLASIRVTNADPGLIDGLHVPEGEAAPKALPSRLLVTRAVHSRNAALAAERDGADALVLGTVFASASHPAGPTIGIEGVRDVVARVAVPVIAIGGITAQNARDVVRAGAAGVAVISAIHDAAEPLAATRELRDAIAASWNERSP